jgi:hypothetical protein
MLTSSIGSQLLLLGSPDQSARLCLLSGCVVRGMCPCIAQGEA